MVQPETVHTAFRIVCSIEYRPVILVVAPYLAPQLLWDTNSCIVRPRNGNTPEILQA